MNDHITAGVGGDWFLWDNTHHGRTGKRTGQQVVDATPKAPGIVVTRNAILDNLVDLDSLKADPLWQRDPITDNWVWRPAEFYAARAIAEEALPAQKEAAEIALGVALLELAKELPPQEDGPRYNFISGVGEYAVICSANQGEYWSHKTSGAALAEWKRRLLEYVTTHPGDVLWWRIRPEIAGQIRFGESEASWAVYGRMLVGPSKFTIEDYRVVDDHAHNTTMHEEAVAAFSDILKRLPVIRRNSPDNDGPYSCLHIASYGAGETLAQAAAEWGAHLLESIGSHKPKWLHWRAQPEVRHEDIFENGHPVWYVNSRATIPVPA